MTGKSLLKGKSLLAACVLSLAGAMPSVAFAGACDSLEAVEWLIGDWRTQAGETLTLESWRRLGAETFEGSGEVRSAQDFALRSREALRLVEMTGAVFFIAKVSHNEFPVAFRLTSCAGETAVFENPGHDFPTRIEYRREGDAAFTAGVSGADGGGFQLHFERVPERRRIALTFDDAPRKGSRKFSGMERTRKLTENLAAAGSPPVIFFSTARNIDEEGDARMRLYQQAGHYIGNHSFTHPGLQADNVEAYLADIRQAHELLSAYERFVPLFRYPFLNEGRDEASRDGVRAALADMGYRNGYVTVDNYDFHMDTLLQRALEHGRGIDYARLGQVYVETLVGAAAFYDDIARKVLGRSPAHVLLLHENDMAALYVGDLIAALREDGWDIIDAVEAYEDPIADITPDTLFNNQGRVAAIAETRGMPRRDLVHPAEDTDYLDRLFEQRGAFSEPQSRIHGDTDLLFNSNREGEAGWLPGPVSDGLACW